MQDSRGNDGRLSPWLLGLCAWLALWQPLNVAVAAAPALQALPVRGWPLGLLLIVRLVIAAVGFAAARALWDRRPGAAAVARTAVLLSGGAQLFVYATSIAPNDRMPGDTPLYVVATIVVHGGWLIYLARSRHIQRLYG